MNKLVNGQLVPLTAEEISVIEAEKAAAPSETDIKWIQVRNERNQLLSKTDWVAARASETGVAVSDDWKTYRQALRDVPTQSDPDNITWPTKPS
tara:strand:+ start:741 stop:1022 length:282 start_codon:yes stop_codon:yes gene_type:complete